MLFIILQRQIIFLFSKIQVDHSALYHIKVENKGPLANSGEHTWTKTIRFRLISFLHKPQNATKPASKVFLTPVNKICYYNPDQISVLIEWYTILIFTLSLNDFFTKITSIVRRASSWRVYPNVKRKSDEILHQTYAYCTKVETHNIILS